MADNDIYALIRQFRSDLLGGDADQNDRIIEAYRSVWTGIKPLLDSLTQDIEEARANGEDISLGWLYRQERYEALLAEAGTAIEAWSAAAAGIITAGQANAILLGTAHAEALTLVQIATPIERAVVSASWNRLPHSALTHLVGAMGDGTPLTQRFEKLAPVGVDAIRTALVQGLAIGQGPRQTAVDVMRTTRQASKKVVADVRDTVSIPLNNALMISRTETLRAYREATRESYEANTDIVGGWIWVCSFSSRTCAACLAMNGLQHPLSEPMASHVCCRCTTIPVLNDESAPQVKDASEWLLRQPVETQENILGKAGAKAFRDGTLTLKDFTGLKHSDQWGSSVYVRSFKGAKKAAGL